jgi:biopolymer transport protein ExbD/biopolymer transport protein TolR
MTASAGGGKRKPRVRRLTIAPVKSVQAEINVTPLVDIVLVLLIIFMVATPLVEKDLAVSLSAEKHTEKAAEIDKEQVVVSIGGAGTLKVNSEPVEQADYVETIRRKLQGRAAEDRVVFVVAEDRAPYRSLVDAIAWAKKAGATTVGLPTDTSY